MIREHRCCKTEGCPEVPIAAANIVDSSPDNPRSCCILCGTWVCHECWDFRRLYATRRIDQACPNCGGVEGEFKAVRHASKLNREAFSVPFAIPTELPKTMREIDRLYFEMKGHYV